MLMHVNNEISSPTRALIRSVCAHFVRIVLVISLNFILVHIATNTICINSMAL